MPDLVLLVNGIPLVVVECKSPGTPEPLAEAVDQLRRYTNQRRASGEVDLEGHAGIVARILGTVFGKDAVSNEAYAGIGLQFLEGGGFDYVSLTELAIGARLAGAVTHQAVVELRWANVVGD